MTDTDYYRTHYAEYHDKTFRIDPAIFLSGFVKHLRPGAHLIDIGCGSGRDLRWLKEKGFLVTGFDASAGMADLARRHARCPVIEGDLETFDFKTLVVDAVLMSGSLVHLPHNRLAPALANILKALRKGPDARVYLSLKEGKGVFNHTHHRAYYLWQDQEIRSIIAGLGLRVLDVARSDSARGTGAIWLGCILAWEMDS
ncbi:MAG: class I SAM-dependent methyltransferase [Desulfobacteraceae bacterium]|jgi:SAM-dependent methyltransferase|nr:MAG: class I SAM-dependent methyltransferase [Desulfobacteraceae bacterium]